MRSGNAAHYQPIRQGSPFHQVAAFAENSNWGGPDRPDLSTRPREGSPSISYWWSSLESKMSHKGLLPKYRKKR